MSATLTRRAMFGSAAGVAIMAIPTVAIAAIVPHPDAAIIAALHRWRAAVLAYVASPAELESAEWEALLGVADDAMDAITPLQPTTIDGLAIKSFMALRHEFSGTRHNELMPDYDSSIMEDKSLPASVGADLLRLSPILAAAVA